MKTHFFLKALTEGDPNGCGKKVHVDFDMDFGFSRDEAFDQCEDLAIHFSDFLHSLGHKGLFLFFTPDELDQESLPLSKFPPSSAANTYGDGDGDEVRLNELRQPNPEKEGTNGT